MARILATSPPVERRAAWFQSRQVFTTPLLLESPRRSATQQYLRAFEQLARRTVEEAWLAGDALFRIRPPPHGAWLPSRQERAIACTTANRFIRLRRQYVEINQVGEFGTVPAASPLW